MSTYITESLGQALLQLMRSKPIEKINVDELTQLAQVGRASYFRNFNSKEEIITAYLVLKWREFEATNHLKAHDLQDSYRILKYFQFCASLKETNSVILSSHCEGSILQAYKIILHDEDLFPNQPYSYEKTYLAYGLYGILIQWIQSGYQETPEEMTQFIQNHIFSVFPS